MVTAKRWPWVKSRNNQGSAVGAVYSSPSMTCTPIFPESDVLEFESLIYDYRQSNNAAPKALLLLSVTFYPSESLRDPKGL